MPTSEPGPIDALRDVHRLAAVQRTGLLDTPAEEEFDRLTRAAALALDAPLAFVTIVDDRRSFWKSCVGLEVPEVGDRQLPVEESLCHFGASTGNSLIVPDARLDERTRASTPVKVMGVRAWASVPLRARGGEVIGSFCVGDIATREWSDSEIAILEALAEATASEIALRDRTAEAVSLARTLQESLLPPDLPQLPGFRITAEYHAADDGIKLVGDFFDVFETTAGQWQVLIGDVTGHGPEAAILAARMRYVLRAAAVTCTGPAESLAHLNQVLLTLGPERRMATAALVTISSDGNVRIASAGHPPPALCRAGAQAELLATRGPLLGAFSFTAGQVREVDLLLAPGDTLVLYTDGITDAGRTHSLGERGLLATLDEVADESAEIIASHVQGAAAACAGDAPRDDAAILLLQSDTLNGSTMAAAHRVQTGRRLGRGAGQCSS